MIAWLKCVARPIARPITLVWVDEGERIVTFAPGNGPARENVNISAKTAQAQQRAPFRTCRFGFFFSFSNRSGPRRFEATGSDDSKLDGETEFRWPTFFPNGSYPQQLTSGTSTSRRQGRSF